MHPCKVYDSELRGEVDGPPHRQAKRMAQPKIHGLNKDKYKVLHLGQNAAVKVMNRVGGEQLRGIRPEGSSAQQAEREPAANDSSNEGHVLGCSIQSTCQVSGHTCNTVSSSSSPQFKTDIQNLIFFFCLPIHKR